MVLKFFVILSLIYISIKAHPSRLKILPGLAFYRTDEGHDDTDDKLIDKDKDLLKSMWNIVDKMDDKTEGESELHRSLRYPLPSSSDNKLNSEPTGQNSGSTFNTTPFQGSSMSRNSVPGVMKEMMRPGKIPPLGTPITTINVFSAYPAVPPKSESHYSTNYHHVPSQYGINYGATPYTNNDIKPKSRFSTNIVQNTGPSYESSKSQIYDSMSSNNPVGYEQINVQESDNILSQTQYDSSITSKMGSPYDTTINNPDDNMYNAASNSEGISQYGSGMENPAGSSPQHFLIPQMMSDMNMGSSVGHVEHMGEMSINYPEINMDNLRSHIHY